MSDFEVKLWKEVVASPAWNMLPAAWAELEKYGFNPPRNAYPNPDSAVLIAYEGRSVVGFIIYSSNDFNSEYHIQMAYTRQGDRRRGIHTLLFNALVQRAEINDIVAIVSGTSIDNIAAQKAFEKQGRHATAIHYEYVVSPFTKSYEIDHKFGV